MATFAAMIDAMLEALIVPSFTRIGFDVRSRLEHWPTLSSYDLRGHVVIITGATSGLGLAAAESLAACGADLEIVGRSAETLASTAARVDCLGDGSVHHTVADVGDLDAVRRLVETVAARHDHVDALVHNAGALDHDFAVSPQGIERTVASQVVGPFLLTELLVPLLRAAQHGRVVWVASGGMYSQPLAVGALTPGPDDYDGTKMYARAKRAQVTLAELWADRLRPDGIVVHAMHPGWADTPGVRHSLPRFRRVVGPLLRTPGQGADTIVWLVADDGDPVATTGRFWLDRRPRSTHRLAATRRADTAAERQRLWDWCEQQSRAPSDPVRG